MYVCICNGHRESDIRQVAREGVSSAQAVYRRLGKPVRCGRCLEVATQVIRDARADGGDGEREVSEVA